MDNILFQFLKCKHEFFLFEWFNLHKYTYLIDNNTIDGIRNIPIFFEIGISKNKIPSVLFFLIVVYSWNWNCACDRCEEQIESLPASNRIV